MQRESQKLYSMYHLWHCFRSKIWEVKKRKKNGSIKKVPMSKKEPPKTHLSIYDKNQPWDFTINPVLATNNLSLGCVAKLCY